MAKMALSENSLKVLNYLKENQGVQMTAKDIADALGLGVKQVNGSVTSAFCRKDLMTRVEAEKTLADGSHQKVKYIKLTDLGRTFDPEATE